MRRGAWHQCGDRSQRLVREQLEHERGVGVILSPRDLSFESARTYASEYSSHAVDILIDLQFCNPVFSNDRLSSYPTSEFRASVSQISEISDRDADAFSSALQTVQETLGTTAVIAPAVKYEASRPDIIDLNARLFSAARRVGDALGIPTYASVILGNSVTSSAAIMNSILSSATAVEADGWYYAFEFGLQERIPSAREWVYRCCAGGLKLACTGKPVLHAYAGPMGVLSLGVGVQGVGIGHWQNLWQFSRGRWEPSDETGGGGGDAPPRMFSEHLWGTIVYPDEFILLSGALRSHVFIESPFSPQSATAVDPSWTRWLANKHLIYVLASAISRIAATSDARGCARGAIAMLEHAAVLHQQIAADGHQLTDQTNTYQQIWREVMEEILAGHDDDYEFLDLIGS